MVKQGKAPLHLRVQKLQKMTRRERKKGKKGKMLMMCLWKIWKTTILVHQDYWILRTALSIVRRATTCRGNQQEAERCQRRKERRLWIISDESIIRELVTSKTLRSIKITWQSVNNKCRISKTTWSHRQGKNMHLEHLIFKKMCQSQASSTDMEGQRSLMIISQTIWKWFSIWISILKRFRKMMC